MDDQEFAGDYGAVVLAEDRLIQYIGHDIAGAFNYAQIYAVRMGQQNWQIAYYPYGDDGKINYRELRTVSLVRAEDTRALIATLEQRINAPKPTFALRLKDFWHKTGLPVVYFFAGFSLFLNAINMPYVNQQIPLVWISGVSLWIGGGLWVVSAALRHNRYGGYPVEKKKKKRVLQ